MYYIDGLNQQSALDILNQKGNLLIHDGLSCFGFGCHISKDEMMKEKYNVISIFSKNISNFQTFFKPFDIPKVDNLVTAWDTFSQNSPGSGKLYLENGEDVYSLTDYFKDWGIYLAERRTEE